jgi:hypothetical protein
MFALYGECEAISDMFRTTHVVLPNTWRFVWFGGCRVGDFRAHGEGWAATWSHRLVLSRPEMMQFELQTLKSSNLGRRPSTKAIRLKKITRQKGKTFETTGRKVNVQHLMLLAFSEDGM